MNNILSGLVMYTAARKIKKIAGAKVSELDTAIAQAILELELNSDLKGPLRELHVNAVKEIDADGKKALVVFVPVPQLKAYQKIQQRLVRELEKKFSGKHVFFIGKRRVLPQPNRSRYSRLTQKRPRNRMLTTVHNAILEDLVYPAEIIGKRVRIRLDGTQLLKVHLDRSQLTNIEHKLDTFVAVYKQLTGKEAIFEFPEFYL